MNVVEAKLFWCLCKKDKNIGIMNNNINHARYDDLPVVKSYSETDFRRI